MKGHNKRIKIIIKRIKTMLYLENQTKIYSTYQFLVHLVFFKAWASPYQHSIENSLVNELNLNYCFKMIL